MDTNITTQNIKHDVLTIGKYAKLWDLMACANSLKENESVLPIGKVNGENIDENWLVKKIADNEKNAEGDHFFGTILHNLQADKYIVAYRGTDFATFEGTFKDFIMTDGQIALGIKSKQLNDAENLFLEALRLVNGEFSRITIIGQSLGGGLAEYVGAKYSEHNLETFTYDALGVKRVLKNEGIYQAQNDYSNINSYMSIVDMVGNLGPHCNKQSYYVKLPKQYINGINTVPTSIKEEIKIARDIVNILSNLISASNFDFSKNLFSIDPANIISNFDIIKPSSLSILQAPKQISYLNSSFSLKWIKEAHLASLYYDNLKPDDITGINNIIF